MLTTVVEIDMRVYGFQISQHTLKINGKKLTEMHWKHVL